MWGGVWVCAVALEVVDMGLAMLVKGLVWILRIWGVAWKIGAGKG